MKLSLHTPIARSKAGTSSGKEKLYVQPKLEINSPGDAFEQEADAMADRVMRMQGGPAGDPGERPPLATSPSGIQRKCAKCEEEEEAKPLLRKAENGAGMAASPGLVSQLSRSKGAGTPLPRNMRHFMEHSFSADFSKVRVHSGPAASSMSSDIRAKAFTHGNDIYFNSGQYNPASPGGRHLLAHELTHVLQQGRGMQQVQRQGEDDDSEPKPFVLVRTILLPLDENKGTVTLIDKDKREITLPVDYQGDPNPGTYTYSGEELSAEDRKRMGGKGIIKKGSETSWILLYHFPKGIGKLVNAPEQEMSVIDKRLLSPQGITRLKPGELAELSELTKDFSAYDFNVLQKYRNGHRSANFEEAKQAILDYRQEKGNIQDLELEEAGLEGKLFGMEAIYAQYKAYKFLSNAPSYFGDINTLMTKMELRNKYGDTDTLKKDLKANLIAHGFRKGDPIADFESYMERFRKDFISTGLHIALMALDSFQTNAEKELQRYRDDPKSEGKIYDRLKASRDLNDKAEDQHARAAIQGLNRLPFASKAPQEATERKALQLDQQSDVEYDKVARDYPILKNYNKADLLDEHRYFFDTDFRISIFNKIESIKDARAAISDDPDYIYKLDSLLAIIYAQKGIEDKSILDLIIKDKQQEIKDDESFKDKIIMLVSLALIPFTFGESAIGLLATTGLAAISSYSAVKAMDKYIIERTFYDAGLLSDKPSTFWLVVAVAGAGLDVTTAINAFGKAAAIAEKFPVFRNDVGKFAEELEKTSLLEQGGKLTAEAQAAERQLKDAIIGQAHVQNDLDVVFTDAKTQLKGALASPDNTKVLGELAHKAVAKGYSRYEDYLLMLKRNNYITDVENLAVVDEAALKQAYAEGIESSRRELRDSLAAEKSGLKDDLDFSDTMPTDDDVAASVAKDAEGAASPRPETPAPKKEITPEQRADFQRQEAKMAAEKQARALADLKRTNPELEAVVSSNKAVMRDGRTTLKDLAAENKDALEKLYGEWKDRLAKGEIKTKDFGDYVRRRGTGFRGRSGELEDAFVRGQKEGEILVKSPKDIVTEGGIDSISHDTNTGRTKLLDNKSVKPGTSIGKVSALEKNLPQNLDTEIGLLEDVVGNPNVPAEIRDVVLPRLRKAREEIGDYMRKNNLELRSDKLASPTVQKDFNKILDNNQIDRVVTFGGAGKDAKISKGLSDLGFKVE